MRTNVYNKISVNCFQPNYPSISLLPVCITTTVCICFKCLKGSAKMYVADIWVPVATGTKGPVVTGHDWPTYYMPQICKPLNPLPYNITQSF